MTCGPRYFCSACVFTCHAREGLILRVLVMYGQSFAPLELILVVQKKEKRNNVMAKAETTTCIICMQETLTQDISHIYHPNSGRWAMIFFLESTQSCTSGPI